jgi:hypothetical protein
MYRSTSRRALTWLTLTALTALLAGCGGAAASGVNLGGTMQAPITNAQGLAYARSVNLKPGDISGFTSTGEEAAEPAPEHYSLEYADCRRGIDPARRIAKVSSTEFTGGSAVIKSGVEVWPTPALADENSSTLDSYRGRACLTRYLQAIHQRINRARKGLRQLGPFTVKITPVSLPGVGHSFLTAINETLLTRRGAVRAHIYHNIFGFISGAAEIELESIGVGHPVPPATEAKALQLLLDRAKARTIH